MSIEIIKHITLEETEPDVNLFTIEYKEGLTQFEANLPYSNPYKKDTQAYKDFIRGYCCGKDVQWFRDKLNNGV